MDERSRVEIEAENKLAAEAENERVHQLVTDFKHSFETPGGKRTYKHLSDFCLEHESTFIVDSERKSSFNEGARAVILEIRRWLDYDLTNLNQE